MSKFSEYLTDTEIISVIGERIRQIRASKRMTREDLAQAVGSNYKTIANIEDGKGFRSSSLISIIRVLGLVDRLETLFEEPVPTLKSLKEIKSTPPERRRVRKSKAERE